MIERPNPGPLFALTFNSSVVDHLTMALSAAYETATEHYDPSRGGNASTFGYCLYHYACHEIGRASTPEISILSRAPLFRFEVGEYELACHRVGDSERQSIWSAFPNSESAAHTMLEEPLWLPGFAEYSGVEKARRLILAHFGNADDGFRAAYLCIPGKTEGTQIVEWAMARNIWTADQSYASVAITDETVVPEEKIDEVVVRRKVKRTTTNAENR